MVNPMSVVMIKRRFDEEISSLNNRIEEARLNIYHLENVMFKFFIINAKQKAADWRKLVNQLEEEIARLNKLKDYVVNIIERR